jgi:hypothetical protein
MKTAFVALMLALTGCGVTETGTAAATAAALKAKDAERAKEIPAKIQDQLDQANAQASRQRDEAESAAK